MPGAEARLTWGRIARRVRVPLGFVLAAFYLWRAKPTWVSLGIGILIAAVGLLVRASAAGQIRKNHELTLTGPYALVRNPLYLGSIVLAIGFAVAARDVWITVAILVVFIFIYVPVIRAEEIFLGSHFQGYGEYARRTPRLLPRRISFRKMTSGFSRELYLRHREYNSLLGAAAMTAVLVLKILWFSR